MKRFLFLLPLFFALLIPNTVDAKKKKYPNGDYYEGEWKKGKPNGMGKMIYADGRIYEGNWKKGKANGYGVMKYSNGGIYDGMWVDNMKMGRGKLERANGERFEGEWKEDKLYKGKGNGYMDSNFYDGEWINGAFQGKCKLKFSNTTEGEQTFDGTIDENGIMEGTVKWANDIATYKGSLKNNKREGYGTLSFSKGNITIEGQWKADDIIQGEGKCIYVDNATYSFIINKYSTYIFTINKSNDTYNIKMETEKGNIACEQRKNCGIQSLCFEIINITSDLRRKDLEQAKKEHEQERELELVIKKQEQEKKQEREKEELLSATIIKLEQPGTILSHLPLHQLNTIQNLTITGFIDETDLAIINKCTNLKFLDLSQANMKLSPKEIKEKQGETLAIGFVMNVVGLGFVADQLNEDENKKKYCVIPAYSFSKLSHLREIKFPNNVTEINGYVCSNCEKLYKVELPAHIEYIGSNAFLGCTSLTDIQFPKSLKYLGSDGNNGSKCAFYYCSSLKKVDLSQCTFKNTTWSCNFGGCNIKEFHFPKNTKTIESLHTNTGTGTNIYIPSSVNNINCTFEGCTLHMNSPIAPTVNRGHHIKYCTIYIPKRSTTSYYVSFGDSNIYKEK